MAHDDPATEAYDRAPQGAGSSVTPQTGLFRRPAGRTDMKLFTKPGCEKCDWVKANMPEGVTCATYDILTAVGLAELAFHELVSTAEKQLPILRLRDGKIVTGAIQIRRELTPAV